MLGCSYSQNDHSYSNAIKFNLIEVTQISHRVRTTKIPCNKDNQLRRQTSHKPEPNNGSNKSVTYQSKLTETTKVPYTRGNHSYNKGNQGLHQQKTKILHSRSYSKRKYPGNKRISSLLAEATNYGNKSPTQLRQLGEVINVSYTKSDQLKQ